MDTVTYSITRHDNGRHVDCTTVVHPVPTVPEPVRGSMGTSLRFESPHPGVPGARRYGVYVFTLAHDYVHGEPIMTRASFTVHTPVSSRFPRTWRLAVAEARWTVGDTVCASCGERIAWVPEPCRVYVHRATGLPGCADGGGVADVERDAHGWAVGPR